jgi:glycosyltransferase involved in cell wall biosynthesis
MMATMSMVVAPRSVATPDPSLAPTVDIVIPVYNEERILEASIGRLYQYLRTSMPLTWRITIVDNGSTDGTWRSAQTLAALWPGVTAMHLERKGRGLALRTAWSQSDAAVLAYMDVDLSTGLDALLPLIAPLVTGHSDVAIGSRLVAGAAVARGPKRELISRGYNLLLRTVFATRFHDAQCGFKAVRADVARRLLPAIADDEWFFDTELLLLAEHNGLRIHEVPVDWVDDDDSRVDISHTVAEDLKGVCRVARSFLSGHGRIDLDTAGRAPLVDDRGRQLVTFGLIGACSTGVSLAVFLWLRNSMGAVGANAVALTATTLANTWANRRYTFVRRGPVGRWRDYCGGLLAYGGGLAATTAALALVNSLRGGLGTEITALATTWFAATIVRFALLRRAPALETSQREANQREAHRCGVIR